MANKITPFIKRMRVNGGTLFSFNSSIEDIGLNINEKNNIVKISHFALLDIPAIKTSSVIGENWFNVQAISGAWEYENDTPLIKDGRVLIAESFQNYASNLETVLLDQTSYNPELQDSVSDRVFWKWLKETGAIRWTDDGSGNIIEDTHPDYTSVVKYTGLVSSGNVRKDTYGTYNETYIMIPTSHGQTLPYFKQITDANYNHGFEIGELGEKICGRDTWLQPHPDGLSFDAHYDFVDASSAVDSYTLDVSSYDYTGAGWWYTSQGIEPTVGSNYYLTDTNAYIGEPSSYYTDLTYTGASGFSFRRSNHDCMSLEFDLDALKTIYDDSTLTYNKIATTNSIATSFNFNTAAIYYTIYNSTGDEVLATNLLGIMFLDAPSGNSNSISSTGILLPSIEKIQSQATGFGTAYSLRLNIKSDNTIDDTHATIIDESTSNVSYAEEFNDTMVELKKTIQILNQQTGTINYISSNYSNIDNSLTGIMTNIAGQNTVIQNQTDTINAALAATDASGNDLVGMAADPLNNGITIWNELNSNLITKDGFTYDGSTLLAPGPAAYSTALGFLGEATGVDSIVIGREARATSTGGIAIGRGTKATGNNAIILGYHSSVQTNSIADSFELAWDGVTAFKAGKLYGTGITSNTDPSGNLTAAVAGSMAWDTTNTELQYFDGTVWKTLITASVGAAHLPLAGGTLTGDLIGVDASFVGDLDLIGVTTGARALRIGKSRTGSGNSRIDLIGDTTYPTYGFRIQRAGGANSGTSLLHRGTGTLNIIADEDASISLSTDSTVRLSVSGVGLTTLTPTMTSGGDVTALLLEQNGTLVGTSVSQIFRTQTGGTNTDFTITALGQVGDTADLLFKNDTGTEIARFVDNGDVSIGSLVMKTPTAHSLTFGDSNSWLGSPGFSISSSDNESYCYYDLGTSKDFEVKAYHTPSNGFFANVEVSSTSASSATIGLSAAATTGNANLFATTSGTTLRSYINVSTIGKLEFHSTTGIFLTDSRSSGNQAGIEYGADYSADYSARSLIDKGYLDSSLALYLPLAGGIMSGTIDMATNSAQIDMGLGSAGTPSIIFNSVNTGLYGLDASTIAISSEGTGIFKIDGDAIKSFTANGPATYERAASATIPVFTKVDDNTTGIGGIAGEVSVIVNGTEAINVTSSGMTVTNNVVVGGDLTVTGSTITNISETVLIEDSLGMMNFGETGNGVTTSTQGAFFVGWEVDRGSSIGYRMGFDEATDSWRTGEYNVTILAASITGTFSFGEKVTSSGGATAYISDVGSGVSKVLTLKGVTGTFTDTHTISTTGGSATISGPATITDSTQTFATREDTPIDTGVAIWDAGAVSLVTDAGLIYDQNELITDVSGNINGALFSDEQNTDVDTGAAREIALINKSTYDGAVINYRVKNLAGTSLRVGIIMGVWDGTLIDWSEQATNDIGDTSDVTMSMDISGSNARLLATVLSNDWDIKVTVNKL
jgi:hypothetical protein